MSETPSLVPLNAEARLDQLFPTVTAEQLARISGQGTRRELRSGEVVYEAGAEEVPFVVVIAGQLQTVRPSEAGDTVITALGPGQFTGEANMLSGHRPLVRVLATEASQVVELTRAQVLDVVQTDVELGEILMRAFILRRAELVARGFGDVVLVGSLHSAGAVRIKEFLTRNGHPFTYVDLDRDADVQELLDHFGVAVEDVPVVICRGEHVLRNPTNQQIAECLGLNHNIDQTRVRDVMVVGAGPAGLAAAVYAASEGLDVLVLDSHAPGGQAGSSSRIENYLGFPMGISGQELASRAYVQAQKFGAEILIAKSATGLKCDRRQYTVRTDDGASVPARTVIIATGAEYRRPALDNLAQFEGVGVYYGATFIESQLCSREEVIVVGGGNAAGQAAVFLAQSATRVHVLVRSDGLAASMSRYLVRRIEDSPSIVLHLHTDLVALEGAGHLERVRWRNNVDGVVEVRDIRHVFLMTGAVPNTRWLEGCVALDSQGFVKTGTELSQADLVDARWPLTRAPLVLETSRPGVFAVGDVRSGSMKRVASAVGEGPDMLQPLLEPYTLGDLPLRNRVVMAPLTRTRAENPGHVPTDLMRQYYQQRASAGLIISEGTWVSENAQGWYGVPGIYNEEQRAAWCAITDAVHARGGRIFAQLWHPGSISHSSLFADGRLPAAPSAVNPEQWVHVRGGRIMSDTPREMTRADVRQAIDEYRNAAEVARDARFDGVQLQAGFLYLIQQFLHETTNRRTDEYGGSIENRARFLFEVLDAVLTVWPSQRVGVKTGPMMNEVGAFKAVPSTVRVSEYVYERLNAYELSHVFLMRQLADLSNTPISALAGEGVLHHFRRLYHGTLILNVGIDPTHGAELLRDGLGDLIAFGRAYIANPDLVERIRLDAPLNEQRPEGYYGSSPVGYTDYPFIGNEAFERT